MRNSTLCFWTCFRSKLSVTIEISCVYVLSGDQTKWKRTKWYGQNGMDKMVYGQNVIGQNGMDKMVRTKCHWTKWYGQNGTDKMSLDKMVASFVTDYN